MTVDDDRPGTKPAAATSHPCVPPGPVETAPYLGYCQPEVRQEAFAAVLAGVQMGAYDTRIVNWLVGWDDPTCRTMACRFIQGTHPTRDGDLCRPWNPGDGRSPGGHRPGLVHADRHRASEAARGLRG
jgi:hypothetical protein